MYSNGHELLSAAEFKPVYQKDPEYHFLFVIHRRWLNSISKRQTLFIPLAYKTDDGVALTKTCVLT